MHLELYIYIYVCMYVYIYIYIKYNYITPMTILQYQELHSTPITHVVLR